jgi:hypothetical protein
VPQPILRHPISNHEKAPSWHQNPINLHYATVSTFISQLQIGGLCSCQESVRSKNPKLLLVNNRMIVQKVRVSTNALCFVEACTSARCLDALTLCVCVCESESESAHTCGGPGARGFVRVCVDVCGCWRGSSVSVMRATHGHTTGNGVSTSARASYASVKEDGPHSRLSNVPLSMTE